ncbi:MAG TPA: DNA polymerase III subunit delta [Mogibacterium sp.]|nr:DNA polymerase III subunit delta [Mogibacterium sp.]
MGYKVFDKDFNNDMLSGTLFFYGAEDYLMDWAIARIIEKYVPKDSRDVDVLHLDGETCETRDIIKASATYSMFAEKRVVVVKNFLPLISGNIENDSDSLLKLASSNQDSSILIFVVEAKFTENITAIGRRMIKESSAYEFTKLDKATLKAFITKQIRQEGKVIGRREMDHLIDISGYFYKGSRYSLKHLVADIFKIAKATEGDVIRSDVIEELMTGEEDKFVFNLIDALMDGNKSKAMDLTETIIREEDSTMAVIALLTKQFEIMYDALELSKEGFSISEMAKRTGVHEFRFKKAYRSAMLYKEEKIRSHLIRLYNIDRNIKSGNIDKDLAFELFVVSC